MALIQPRLIQVSGVGAASWPELVKHWWQWVRYIISSDQLRATVLMDYRLLSVSLFCLF
jgi:hypothetical protein